MKKVLALVIAAMMVISMFPVMALTTSAVEIDGMWDTFRRGNDYTETDDEGNEVEKEYYCPTAGYEYTDEGFSMISADYRNSTPYTTVQSKDKVNIREGFYMEFRVDDYSYGGEPAEGNAWGTADHWMSFHIVTNQGVSPADSTTAEGWVSLVRHGHGNAADANNIFAQSFVQTETPDSKWPDGKFHCTHPQAPIVPKVDSEGRRIYTFAGSYTEEGGYSISICGVELGHADITNTLNALDPDGTGEFYIGVTLMSSVADGTAAGTILKYGTSEDDCETPMGTDSKDPEVNNNYIAEITPSTEVPEGQPAMIFDATGSSWTGSKVTGQNIELTAQGDDSFKIDVFGNVAYFQWSVSRDVSYEAKDFPVIAFLVNDPNMIFNDGVIRFATGDQFSADDIHVVNYSLYNDDCLTFGDGDWFLVVVDLATELEATPELFADWTGRINSLRFDSNDYGYSADDPESNHYFFHWAGVFRTVADAQAYGTAYMDALSIGVSTEAPETEAPETDAPVETDAPADTNASAETGATASTEGGDTEPTEGGCASVIGFGSVAVLMAAAAAAVVLKKKD